MKKVQELDRNIRGLISKKLCASGIPTDLFYTHWIDGGLSLPLIEERTDALQIRTFLGLVKSKDNRISKLVLDAMMDEADDRKLTKADEFCLLGYSYDMKNEEIEKAKKRNNIFIRALTGCKRLQLSFNFDNDGNIIMKDCFEGKVNNESCEVVDVKSVLQKINIILRNRHKEALHRKEFHGHSFTTLNESPCSNYFIGNHRAPVPDRIARFAITARFNGLPTKELIHKHNEMISDKCSICSNNGNPIDSLMHR